MVFFSAGFRPMFLGAALWSFATMALWIAYLNGSIDWQGPLEPLDWHVHALLFGYGGAVVCGFLLTAVPNWTGRPPVAGAPLMILAALWIIARFVTFWDFGLSARLILGLDLSFPVVFCLIATREIALGRNNRNFPVVAAAVGFAAANAAFDISALFHPGDWSGYGTRLGIAVLIMLLCLIGGRIVPAFTRNWLKQHGSELEPALFGRFDAITLGLTGVALASWVGFSGSASTNGLLVLVAILHVLRLARWQGVHTKREPLLASLHVGYAFIPLGFVLSGVAGFSSAIPASAGIHAWTAGAIGTMTLTVMSRATLGHSGRALKAGVIETLFLAALPLSALTRILAALGIWADTMLTLSATLWITAFGLFAIRFAPVMFAKIPAEK